MREKKIEQALVKAVVEKGGLCPKWVSPGMAGVPDRMVLMPGGITAFVEVKQKGQKPRPLQTYRHKQLRGLGFKVYVLDDKDDIEKIVKELEE